MTLPEPDVLTQFVSRVFRIDDVTIGDSQNGKYLFRYRGLLLLDDSADSYNQLTNSLSPYGITPLFRVEGEQQVIYLIKGNLDISPSKLWVNGLMFGLTVLSVWLAGAMYAFGYNHPNVEITSLMELYRVSIMNFWDTWWGDGTKQM
jgi:hypothetical protein